MISKHKKKVRMFLLLLGGPIEKASRGPMLGRSFKRWRDYTYMSYRSGNFSPMPRSPFKNLTSSLNFSMSRPAIPLAEDI